MQRSRAFATSCFGGWARRTCPSPSCASSFPRSARSTVVRSRARPRRSRRSRWHDCRQPAGPGRGPGAGRRPGRNVDPPAALGLDRGRAQGARRPPPRCPLADPAPRARARRGHPALLRVGRDPRRRGGGDRGAGGVPGPVHARLDPVPVPPRRCVRRDRRAAARDRLRVRRRQPRAHRTDAPPPPRPADPPR